MKNIPKSLHTVTAFARVAQYINHQAQGTISSKEAIRQCVELLGYRDATDTYGLEAAALKQVKRA